MPDDAPSKITGVEAGMIELRNVLAVGWLACAVALAACGGPANPVDDAAGADAAADDGPSPDADFDAQSPEGGTDDAGPPDNGWTQGQHEPLPQMPNQGGPVLAHPRLVTLTYPNDANAANYEAYASWIVGSDWLRVVGADYGVGDGSVVGAARWPSSAPSSASDTTVRSLLTTGIQDGTVPVPSDGDLSNVIFLFYFPRSTSYSRPRLGGGTDRGCTDFFGYHNTVAINGSDVPYAVILDCGVVDATTELASTQITASHEIIETATDPNVHDPAYSFSITDTTSWLALGGETADLCQQRLNYANESGFAVARSWSNTAAQRGDNPCVPNDASSPYFNTSVSPADRIQLAPGSTATFTLNGWSTGQVADWPISVRTTGVTVPVTQLSATSMNNGGTATLDITVPATASTGYIKVALRSGNPSGVYQVWPILILVQ